MTSSERQARFEELVPLLLEPLRRFLARRADAATADDALGETLLVLWRRLDDVPVGRELPWAYGAARLCLANAERGARRQARVAARLAVLNPPTETASSDGGPVDGGPVDGGPAADDVREALAALGEDDAELLRLWAWEQLGAAEIAVVLGVSPNAVHVRLHRARGRLREELRKIRTPAGHEGS